jgi:hypothetical protein
VACKIVSECHDCDDGKLAYIAAYQSLGGTA